jgi:Holliday junction resolvase RusA-like endonuclease
MKPASSTTNAPSVVRGEILPIHASAVSFVVLGKPVSMKNRRRMFKSARRGKFFPAKSEEAARYVQDFCHQVPPQYRNIKLGALQRPLRLICSVYYPSRRSDLDIAIVMDSLQISGVIRNDRDIIEQHLWAGVDTKNPRVEIEVSEI